MGLLDNFNFDDPATMGLLSAGANILSNSGRGNTAQVIGEGLSSGMQGAGDVIRARRKAIEDAQNLAYQKMQLDTGNLNLQQINDTVQRNKLIRDEINKNNIQDLSSNQLPQMSNAPQSMPQSMPQSIGTQSDMPSQMPDYLIH